MTTDAGQAWDAAAYGRRFGFVAQLAEDLVGLLDPQPGERIVDLGCGTGTLAAAIAARGADVLGIDADPAMIEAARVAYPALRFEVISAYDVTIDPPVDAVFSNAALHWMTRPEDVLRRVAAALRPGGRFVAEMGGGRNTELVSNALRDALTRRGIPPERQARPWYFPTPAEYATLLERHGFEVRALWHFERFTQLAPGEHALADWLTMFASPITSVLTPEDEAALRLEVEDATRDALYIDGHWHVDYRRLRFVAVRV
ncbi:MAG: methyltransferase domain-containing protein [Dehalococcoidia bacterium]